MEVACALRGMEFIREKLHIVPAEFVSDACTSVKAAASK